MPSLRATLGFATLAVAAAKKSATVDWKIPVYVRIQSLGIRALSAVSSSFIYEGRVDFAWRDDTLIDSLGDGAPYKLDSKLSNCYNPEGKEVTAYNQYFCNLNNTQSLIPFVETSFLGLASGFTQNVRSVNVEYTWQDWTGAPYSDSSCYDLKKKNEQDPDTWTCATPEEDGYGSLLWQPVWVVGSITFATTFQQPQQLQDFPFDTQNISFVMFNQQFNDGAMYYVLAPSMNSSPNSSLILNRDPDGFTATAWQADVGVVNFLNNSAVRVSYQMQRIPTFFINRLVVPLSLLFMIITCMIIVTPQARIMSPLTAFGSTVSFLFVSGQSVPQLPYATRLDRFFSLCFFYAFCLFLYHAIMWFRFERLKTAIEKSKQRNTGLGSEGWNTKQATWFSPKTVPDAKKLAKTYAELKKQEAEEKAKAAAAALTVRVVAEGEKVPASDLEKVSLTSPAPKKEGYDPEKASNEQIAVLKDIATFLYPQYHKDFKNPNELRPVGILGILWGDMNDLTAGVERIDLFMAPVFFITFAVAASIILRGPIQYI